MEQDNNKKLYLVHLSFYGYQEGVVPITADSEEEAKKFFEEQFAKAEKPPKDIVFHSVVQSEQPKDLDELDKLLEERAEEVEEETNKVIN